MACDHRDHCRDCQVNYTDTSVTYEQHRKDSARISTLEREIAALKAGTPVSTWPICCGCGCDTCVEHQEEAERYREAFEDYVAAIKEGEPRG